MKALRSLSGCLVCVALLFGAGAASATTFGYGQFIGSWSVPDNSTNQPTPNSTNVALWGQLILDSPVVDPNAFDPTTDFHIAGIDGSWPSDGTYGALTFTSTNGGTTGTWTYEGGANGGQPVDMYIGVKYDHVVSVFRYFNVVAHQSGLLTSDATVINDYNSANNINATVATCPTPTQGATSSIPDSFDMCMGVSPNDTAYGISTVVGWWPPGTAVPEPASLALLGIGLVGLGWSRRKRAA